MEDAGRVRRGYFVAGLGGAQFALPGAVDRLRSARATSDGEFMIMAATDPANPFGVSLPWPREGLRRVAGAYVVSVDGLASLYVERAAKGLVALRDLDGGWEDTAVAALNHLITSGHVRRLAIERYDEGLEPALKGAGFVPSRRGLVRYG
jgi:ATP-dependent Lhr-like helicase